MTGYCIFLSLLNGIPLQKRKRQFDNLTAILTSSLKYSRVHLFRVFFIIKQELVCSIAIDRITRLVIAVLGGKITYLQNIWYRNKRKPKGKHRMAPT